MRFIEMTGKTLLSIVHKDEMEPGALQEAGVTEDTVVRINEQGDIEIRRSNCWDVVGGLLGEFEHRIKRTTNLDWV